MKDRSLGVMLMLIFGGSGLGAIVVTWALPGFVSDRITATLVGAAGILVATVCGLMLRRHQDTADKGLTADIPVEGKN